jgi:hypothetical protein
LYKVMIKDDQMVFAGQGIISEALPVGYIFFKLPGHKAFKWFHLR